MRTKCSSYVVMHKRMSLFSLLSSVGQCEHFNFSIRFDKCKPVYGIVMIFTNSYTFSNNYHVDK